tara:strand:+ start:193 stop:498 length:306 start_codon:yes stop_codon:yes gene_type:complete
MLRYTKKTKRDLNSFLLNYVVNMSEMENEISKVIVEQLEILDNCELKMIDKIKSVLNKNIDDNQKKLSLRIIIREFARINREQQKQTKELKRIQKNTCLIE